MKRNPLSMCLTLMNTAWKHYGGRRIVSIFAIPLNTLGIRGIDHEREDLTESGPVADLEFLVPNMVCEGCADKIAGVLSSMPGVREVKSKVSQKRVYVRYEPTKVREEELKEVVHKAGFTVVEA